MLKIPTNWCELLLSWFEGIQWTTWAVEWNACPCCHEWKYIWSKGNEVNEPRDGLHINHVAESLAYTWWLNCSRGQFHLFLPPVDTDPSLVPSSAVSIVTSFQSCWDYKKYGWILLVNCPTNMSLLMCNLDALLPLFSTSNLHESIVFLRISHNCRFIHCGATLEIDSWLWQWIYWPTLCFGLQRLLSQGAGTNKMENHTWSAFMDMLHSLGKSLCFIPLYPSSCCLLSCWIEVVVLCEMQDGGGLHTEGNRNNENDRWFTDWCYSQIITFSLWGQMLQEFYFAFLLVKNMILHRCKSKSKDWKQWDTPAVCIQKRQLLSCDNSDCSRWDASTNSIAMSALGLNNAQNSVVQPVALHLSQGIQCKALVSGIGISVASNILEMMNPQFWTLVWFVLCWRCWSGCRRLSW